MQHRCARDEHDCADDDAQLADERTLDARLRAFYAEAPRTLSVAELAKLFTKGDERQIQRAHHRIRKTYRDRFVERVRRDGRSLLAPSRWIRPKPGGIGTHDLLSSCEVDLRIGNVDLEANADRARARPESAPCYTDLSESRDVRGSRGPGVRPPPRRRAVRHGVTNPPLMTCADVELEALAALRKAHPDAFDELFLELHRKRYHEHPIEASRVVRTLVDRTSATPLRLMRDLMNRACNGDALCDGEAEREVDERLELEAREQYAWDPDNPSTHWPDLIPEGTAAPPPLEELEPDPEELARLAARKRLEHEFEVRRRRREAERIVGLLLRATGRSPPTAAERFLNVMKGRGLEL